MVPWSSKLNSINLAHLYKLTNSQIGLFQHAKFSEPNLKYGYTTDDNARALILIINLLKEKLLPKESSKLKELEKLYFDFLKRAYNAEINAFHNFLSSRQTWLDEKGSEDSQARALWALGYTVNFGSSRFKKQATLLFKKVASNVVHFTSPRAWAISLRGIYYSQIRSRRQKIKELSQRLKSSYQKHQDKEWQWYEDYLTYDNAQLPLAMLLGGYFLEEEKFIQIGLKTLRWLLEIQKAKRGHLSLVGNKGWFFKGKKRAQFDQQPLEVPGLIDSALLAYQITQEEDWLKEAQRCFAWFLGENDLGEALIDFRSGACGDGLEKRGVNKNQGTESTLAWLWSITRLKHFFSL